MIDDAPLPPLLSSIADALGSGAALRLAREAGGGILYVPNRPSERFIARFGAELATWLCEHHASVHLEVPLGPTGARAERTAALRAAIERGEGSASTLARRFGIVSRTVKRHRADLRDGEDLPLFAPSKPRT